MIEALALWFTERGCCVGPCGGYGSKAFDREEIGLDAPKLVNVLLLSETVSFNDVDGGRHSIQYSDPALFDILESVLATGRVGHSKA